MNLDFLIAFALGLLIGSFVNVLIHRLPRMVLAELDGHGHAHEHGQNLNLCRPTSHCPHCLTPLKAWHNIPVLSYLWLKGRCSFCQHPIGLAYPLTELSIALLWLGSSWLWGFNPTALSWAACATLLVALSIIDWQTTLLPDELTQALLWGGLMASAAGWNALDVSQSVWGAVAGYTSLWLVATGFEQITGKQGMGAGDFKLLAGLGAWLGPWALIPLVMLASTSGAVVGLALKFNGQLREGGYVPFGPFLAAAGAFIAVVGMPRVQGWLGW